MSNLLSFGRANQNTKLSKHLVEQAATEGYTGKRLTFSLPAGHSCPFALDCQSLADPKTGKITDGKHTRFRCYAASDEAARPNVRASRWRNYELLREAHKYGDIYELIITSLMAARAYDNRSLIRWHVSGDFFNQPYFDAVCLAAAATPTNLYYAYTKALPYLVSATQRDLVPSNLRVIASRGGRRDDLIDQYGLREAVVVFSREEARERGLEIDEDDTLACFGTDSFALLLHNTQPAGSEASEALKAINRQKRTLKLEAVMA